MHTFSNGEIATALQLNGNFQELYALIMSSSLSFDSLGNPLPDDFGSLPSVIVNDSQGRASTITKSGVSGTYVQTFTYPDSVTTNISAWVKQ